MTIRLFRLAVPTSILVLLLSEVVLLTSCYVVTAFFVLDVDPTIFLWYDGGFARILVVVVSILIALHFFLDFYSNVRSASKLSVVLDIGQAIGLAFLVQALVAYLNKDWMLPRWLMIWASGSALVLLSAWRVVYGTVVLRAFGSQRVLFLGFNPAVREIARHLAEHPEAGYLNLGYLDDATEAGTCECGAKVLGPVASLAELARGLRPDRIIVGMTERRERMPLQSLLDLRFSGVLIEEASFAYENASGRVATQDLRPAQLIFSSELGPTRRSALQSAYSPILALVGIVASLPFALLAALAVHLTSRGPVLYRQTRVGKDGVPFTLFKFRSMYVDAEEKTGAVWASPDDPRVTAVGRWLRKLRIDEIPQLWNVLRGEMSLVGPRPERPEFVRSFAEKIPFYRQRHCVRPGITGWAQINHKYGDTFEDTIIKLEYDLYYIKHMSLALDAFVVFQTVKTILRSRGAQ